MFVPIDELGYLPFDANAANLFFQLVASRYEQGSLLITSNLSFGWWGEVFTDDVVAAAMIDRLVHHAEVLTFDGESYRTRTRRELIEQKYNQPTLKQISQGAIFKRRKGVNIQPSLTGSCRVPAALSGLVGVKAQFGRIPVHPGGALDRLGHIGVLARTVKDAALRTQALSGFDDRDPFSSKASVPNLVTASDLGVAGMRIAWSPSLGYAPANEEVLMSGLKAAKILDSAGAVIEQRDSVFCEDPVALLDSEFYACMGPRLRDEVAERAEMLEPALVKMVESSLHYESLEDFLSKRLARSRLRERFRRFMESHEVLICPTLPITERTAGVNIPPGFEDRHIGSWGYFTYPFNLTGNPALSVPCGLSKHDIPIGLQVVTKSHHEVDAFRVVGLIETEAPWRHLYPTLHGRDSPTSMNRSQNAATNS